MLSTVLTRMSQAWRRRETPAIRLALGGAVLLLLAAAAHLARQGTLAARLGAGSVLLLVLGTVLVWGLRAGRQWHDERRVLRRILFSVDHALGKRAVRAYNVVEQTQADTSLGSPVLAKHHYERVLKQASLAAVNQAASRRATRWRWAGLFAGLVFLGLLIPDPIRLMEGFSVLIAQDGKSPVNLTFVDLKQIAVKPPSYLREPVRTAMPGVSGRFATGSTIVVQGKPRYDGRQLVLTNGLDEVPFVGDGHGGITAKWTLMESVELRVASRYGEVRIEEPEALPLEALADQTPRVWIEGAPKTLRLKQLEQLDIRYRAEDDHGIRQVDLVITSGKRETRRVLLKLDGEDRTARGGYSIEPSDDVLKRMFLPVHIHVEAKDDDPISGPKWGRSQGLVVLPPVAGEPEAERYAALETARDQLLDVLALYAEPAADNPKKRREQLEGRREARARALKQFQTTIESNHAGLPLPEGFKNFLLGQLRVLKKTPRPGVSPKRQLEDAILAFDVALARLATREARSVAVLLADVVEDVAEGAEQALETEARAKGLGRLDHSLELATQGAAQLGRLGVLGADLGSVAQGDLDRVRRARRQDDLMHAELAARHLAARLRRPNPSFGTAGRGGVESGASGQSPPTGQPSKSDQQFDQLAQELEQLAREHAQGLMSVEEALEKARETTDNSELAKEAQERAQAVRESVRQLPEVGAEPGSARAAAALAREHARAMAQNLERLDLETAVESGEQAISALQEAKRKSENGSLSDWLDPAELEKASGRIGEQLSWARRELARMKKSAEEKAKEGLNRASKLERELAERAGNLSGRGRNDQTPLPEDVLRRLDRAEALMRQAAQELAEGSAERGLGMQRDAQRLLEQSQTGKTSDRRQDPHSRGEQDGGKNLRLGGEVPDPDDENQAADFRERVLRGLGREREGRLAPAVKRYAEELLR